MAKEKTKKKHVKLIVFLCVTGALIAAFILYGAFFADKTIHINGVTVGRADIAQYVSLKGTLLSSEKEELFAPAQVTVQELHIQKGDVVKAGDLLAGFDVADLKNSYNQAALQYANAKLVYEDALRSNEENEEKALSNQRRIRYTQDEIDSLDEMNDASEIAELKSELAEYKADRKAALNSAISDEKLKQYKNSMDLAGISVNSSKKYLDEGKAGITAGISGVVTELTLSKGGMTASSLPCIVIQSLDNPEIEFSLGKYDLDRIKTGQPATITIGTAEYPGRVLRIDSITTTDTTGVTVKARAAFDKLPENIVLGLEADLSIQIAERKNVITLPFELIRTDREGDYCLIAKDGVARKVPLELGIGSDTHSEIISGLEQGDTVILNPPAYLTDGMPVTVDSLA